MAIRQLTNGYVTYLKWGKDVDEGTVFPCFFIESKESTLYKGNLTHYVEHAESGNRYGLSGCANLDRALEQIGQGTYIEITYEGSVVIKNGPMAGKPCHQFNIVADDERIHPQFGGSADSLKPVAYVNSPAAEAKAEAAQAETPQTETPAAPVATMQPPVTTSEPAAEAPAAEAPPAEAPATPPPAPAAPAVDKPKKKLF